MLTSQKKSEDDKHKHTLRNTMQFKETHYEEENESEDLYSNQNRAKLREGLIQREKEINYSYIPDSVKKQGEDVGLSMENVSLMNRVGNTAQLQAMNSAKNANILSSMRKDSTDAIQSKKENKTGIPDELKEGVENQSGISMDNVRVHYNSDKPKGLGALAYTQGTEIHVGPGQEMHLPHETWHVVQQAQGRVKPTMQMKGGVNVNNDFSLETEADVMGRKSFNLFGKGNEGKKQESKIDNNLVEKKLSCVTQGFGLVSNGPVMVTQMVSDIKMKIENEAENKKGLENIYNRQRVIDLIYDHIFMNENYIFYSINSIDELSKHLKKKYSDFNEIIKKGSPDEINNISKELLARFYHDNNAVGENEGQITEEMITKLENGQELDKIDTKIKEPDITASIVDETDKKNIKITSNLNTLKACVITALMFAEGGGVLGANSVEELHFILSTRFKKTWRHYSDDKVHKSLYEFMGYKQREIKDKRVKDLATVLNENETVGMINIGKHMIGFRVEAGKIYLRDNEGTMEEVSKHGKNNENIKLIWTK